MSVVRTTTPHIQRRDPSELADVAEIILDRGMVIDAFARVAPLGTEVLFGDGRITMGSADSYLHFAQAADRLLVSGAGRDLRATR